MLSVIENSEFSVYCHTGPPIGTHSYLFVDQKTRDAMVIDASLGSAEAFNAFAIQHKIVIHQLVDTHGHWDHVMDNHKFLAAGIPLWIHPLDTPMIGMNQSMFMSANLTYVPTEPSAKINEGDIIRLGHFSFLVMHTPGHTPGGICLYEKSAKIVFTGDTLFHGTYGRTDFPGGSVTLMQQSLLRLSKLPYDVMVFPGHSESTTIGTEAWIKNLTL